MTIEAIEILSSFSNFALVLTNWTTRGAWQSMLQPFSDHISMFFVRFEQKLEMFFNPKELLLRNNLMNPASIFRTPQSTALKSS